MSRLALVTLGIGLATGLAGAAVPVAQAAAEENRPPEAPTELALRDLGPAECGDFVPGVPRMQARLSDPDGDDLTGTFRVTRLESGAWGGRHTVTDDNGSGLLFSHEFEPAWAQSSAGTWIDTKYAWSVQATELRSDGQPALSGPRSPFCYFVLDTADPKLRIESATITQPGGKTVSLIGSGTRLLRGGQIKIVLDPAGSKGYGNVNDVDRYQWDFWQLGLGTNEVVDPGALGSKGVVYVDTTELSAGPMPLVMAAEDRAGRRSATRSIDVFLAGADQYADYTFDEPLTSTRAADSLDDGTRSSTFVLTKGATRSVNVPNENHNLHLDGVSGTAVSGTPVVKPAFSSPYRSFTVGAWARPTDVNQRRVLASQETRSGQIYSLGITPCGDAACSFFTLRNPDTGEQYTARSSVPLRTDEWVYLAGSYNDFMPTGRRIQAWAQYPNTPTTQPGTTWLPRTFSLPAMSAGNSRIGSETSGGRARYFWAGDVESLRYFEGSLIESEVRSQMWPIPAGPVTR